MTTEQKLLTLLQRLRPKTESGELRWERTVIRDIFQAAFTNYIVRLSTVTNEHNPDALDYIVSIFDESGNVIESASDFDIQKSAGPGVQVFELMKELYIDARRQVLGVDSALDSLLTEIETIGEHEPSPLDVEREILEAIKRITDLNPNSIPSVSVVISQTSLGRSALALRNQRWRFERLRDKRMIKLVGENSSGEFGIVLDAKGQERLNVPEKLFQTMAKGRPT